MAVQSDPATHFVAQLLRSPWKSAVCLVREALSSSEQAPEAVTVTSGAAAWGRLPASIPEQVIKSAWQCWVVHEVQPALSGLNMHDDLQLAKEQAVVAPKQPTGGGRGILERYEGQIAV